MRFSRLVGVAAVFVLGLAASAGAQGQDSHWGVSGSFVPLWKVPNVLGEVLGADEFDFTGSEFRIGAVRGRDLSGDWGVSFVHKNVKDGSRVGTNETESGGPGEFYLARGISFTGVEVHKFIPFATIRRRVQIGMNIAGGVARWKGMVESHEQEREQFFDPVTRRQTVTYRELVTMKDIRDESGIKVLPLASIEAAGAVIVAPGLKIRVTGGFNLPGYQIASVTFVYLFGAR